MVRGTVAVKRWDFSVWNKGEEVHTYLSASADADGSNGAIVPRLVGEKPSGRWDGSELGAVERLMVAPLALAGTDQSDRTTVSKPSHCPLSSTFVIVKVCLSLESPLA